MERMRLGVRAAKRQRTLTRTVKKLSSCLDAIPPLTERILRLRSGVGRPAPLSRDQVARVVDRPRSAVRRIERRGIRRLRDADRRGACGGAGGGAAPGGAVAPDGTGAPAGLTAVSDTGDGAGGGGSTRSEDTAGTEGTGGSEGDRGGVKAESEERSPLQAASPPPEAFDIAVPLILVAALVAGTLVGRRIRRET